MNKFMENKKDSPYIWAARLGKIPSSSPYLWARWGEGEVAIYKIRDTREKIHETCKFQASSSFKYSLLAKHRVRCEVRGVTPLTVSFI